MPAIEMEGGAVPEAKLLFSMLRDICVVCSKSRADLKPHHCLRAKLASFAFSRTVRSPCAQNQPHHAHGLRPPGRDSRARPLQVESLVSAAFFTPRPINLYFACTQHPPPQRFARIAMPEG